MNGNPPPHVLGHFTLDLMRLWYCVLGVTWLGHYVLGLTLLWHYVLGLTWLRHYVLGLTWLRHCARLDVVASLYAQLDVVASLYARLDGCWFQIERTNTRNWTAAAGDPQHQRRTECDTDHRAFTKCTCR